MSEKITQLKKQAEAGKFQEVFNYLDLYFEENPYNQYSTIKMNIEHQINMGFAPNPMQVQGLQLFLNGSKIKEVVPIIEENHKSTPQKPTETMAYGTETEIKGIKKAIDLLLEKQEFLSEELGIASGNQKFSLKKQLQQLETELETYRQKIQKLKGENPNNSELRDLENKTQKAQIEMTEFSKNNKLNSNLNYLYDNDLEFLRNCYKLLESSNTENIIFFLKETGFEDKYNLINNSNPTNLLNNHKDDIYKNNAIINQAVSLDRNCRVNNKDILAIKNCFKEFTKDEKIDYILNIFSVLEIMLSYQRSAIEKQNGHTLAIQEMQRQIKNYREENTNGTMEEKSNDNNKTSVFISYNHKDKITANKIKDFLRTKGIDVTIDSEAMKSGEDIKTFIEKCVRENDITLSLVSENSLLSAWVAMEGVLTFAGEKLANKKFIAVYEDDSFMKRSFTDDALDKVEEEILDISTTIQKRLSKNRRIEDLQNDLSRYKELENNLPQIIGRLKGSLCIPIGEDKFEEGMQKISNEIK